jgi:hypothetical protein
LCARRGGQAWRPSRAFRKELPYLSPVGLLLLEREVLDDDRCQVTPRAAAPRRPPAQVTTVALVCLSGATVKRKLLRTGVWPLFTVYSTLEDAVFAITNFRNGDVMGFRGGDPR